MSDEVMDLLLNVFLYIGAAAAAMLVGSGYRAHVDGDYSRASWDLGVAVFGALVFFKLLLS